MEKKADCVILYHKEVPYGIWDDEIWTPLEVGAAQREKVYDFGLRDNLDPTRDKNISDWNLLFAETTGMFFNWKHLSGKKYAGQVQYRRRFDIRSYSQLEDMFKEHNVLAANPIMLSASVKRQYGLCHNVGDLEWIKEIIVILYPEYEDSFNRYIENGNILFYSNGFIMKEPLYDDFCGWLFDILFEFKKYKGWKSPEDVKKYVERQINEGLRPRCDSNGKPDNAVNYQSQICGFLSERLWTLYLLHNFNGKRENEVVLAPYLKMENCF